MIIATRKIQNENKNCHQENSFWQSLQQKPQRLLLHTTSLRGRWCHIFGWCQSFLTSQLKMSSRILCYIEKQYLQNFEVSKKNHPGVSSLATGRGTTFNIAVFKIAISPMLTLSGFPHEDGSNTSQLIWRIPRKWDLLPNQAAHQYWELSLPPIVGSFQWEPM